MRFKIGAVAVIAGLAGCNSVDDLRKQPVSWTATFPATYEVLANCLAAQYARDLSVVPQMYPSERRANVILSNTAAGSVMAEFNIRQTAADASEVSWRSIGGVFGKESGDRLARERADRCSSRQH